jgi:hypothetical protein
MGCRSKLWPEIDERAQQGKAIRELGKSLPVPEQEELVRGALISNIEAGEDKAIQSIKALAKTRDLGMFQPEIQTGIVVLNLPQSAVDHKAEILNAEEEE